MVPIWQFALNIGLAFDHALNTLLLGDPNETVSRRTARAALEGSKPACIFCRVLGWFRKNHCTRTLQAGTVGREIWHWSNNFSEPTL